MPAGHALPVTKSDFPIWDLDLSDHKALLSHRQAMRTNFLASEPETVDDEDLLEMLLFLTISWHDTKPLARTIIKDCGDLYQSCQADDATLRRLGLGHSSIGMIELVRESARRLNLAKRASRPLIANKADLADYLDIPARLQLPPHTAALLLDAQNLLWADLSFPVFRSPEDVVNAVMRRAVEGDASTLIVATMLTDKDQAHLERERALGVYAAKLAAALSINFREHLVFGADGVASSMHLGLI